MHYLLGDQNFYFPSSDDQSYSLQVFLQNKRRSDCHLPVIVKIKSLDIPHGPMRTLLAKNTPLLLLDTDQLHSILAEYHPSSRYRSALSQAKISKKFLSKKKFSKSLVTFSHSHGSTDHSDDDYDNTRTILRTLNERRSTSTVLCRVPIDYQGFFELLNENDQSMEPFHRLADLLIDEEKENTAAQLTKDKSPQAFFLRSPCIAYTRRYMADERKLSGSGDSCYGSLSDLESHKNLLILNDDRQILPPGQIISILSPCSVYRSDVSERIPLNDAFLSHSSATSWLRQKSRLLFPRKKSEPSHPYENSVPKNTHEISRRPERFLKCRTELGDTVYISPDASGLFSPLHSPPPSSLKSTGQTESLDISGVSQLKQLLHTFRFPISVRLLDSSLSFDNAFAPAMIHPQDSSSVSSTKFRLLLPYTEHVVYACPLITSSSIKTLPIVIPIPINTEMEVQRCLNMREIAQNRCYQDLVQICSYALGQYQTQFSQIHFPLLLNTDTLFSNKRKPPLFKKRSQSESHLEYALLDATGENHRKSCETLNHDPIMHRDSFQTIKQKLFNQAFDSRQQAMRRSTNYAKMKVDRPRKSSQQPDVNSDDENYREVDHIYDYIRSGDLTDDVKRIQAKEEALNTTSRQKRSANSEHRSSALVHATVKVSAVAQDILFTIIRVPFRKQNTRVCYPWNLIDFLIIWTIRDRWTATSKMMWRRHRILSHAPQNCSLIALMLDRLWRWDGLANIESSISAIDFQTARVRERSVLSPN